MKKLFAFIDNHPYKTVWILALTMNVVLLCLQTRSLLLGVLEMFGNPVSALYNALILLAFYIIALFFKRRFFALSLISILWLGLGITNCVVLGMRVLPLQAIDFYIIRTGVAIIGVYMSVPAIILSSLAILLGIALLGFLFFKAPRSSLPPMQQLLLATLCILLSLLLFSFAFIGLGNANPDNYDNIDQGYDTYGFPYCFLRSIFDRGIEKPDGYSEETTEQLLSSLATRETVVPENLPNVIFVQLESFFDVSRLANISFSQDPIPNFHKLEQEGFHGKLTVPGIGSGTVNTEFEVLTGLPLNFFGTGEYPYKSVLRTNSCETLAYNLLSLGYSTHAFHNHTASFYDRYQVYANLGFDSFTASEYMKNLTYNDLGWEKDEILTSYILKALDSTQGKDFVFAVTVEGHGGYPEIPTSEENAIEVYGIEDEGLMHSYTYFVNSLHETDAFLGALTQALSARKEETFLVLYGDHLPTLNLTEESFTTGDMLQTDYVIWSTNGFSDERERCHDIPAYSLFPLSFSLLGIENGLVPHIWNEYADSETYLSLLHLVAYDSLYGERLAYGSEYPYQKRNMTLGIDKIKITEIATSPSQELFVTGENFTPDSQVFINNRRIKTEFLSENTLYIENEKVEIGDEISVVQVSVDLRKLSETEKYIVTKKDFLPN